MLIDINSNPLKNILTTGLLATTFAILFSACHSGSVEGNAPTAEDTASIQNSQRVVKAQTVFFSLPSPVETTMLLKKAGTTFNKDYLNPSKNVSNYSSTSSKALNLGVYGTDLSYTGIFDQTQEMMLYMKSVSSLAKDLSIVGAFDERTIARTEKNINNRDSLLQIISDAFWSSDSYLKDNNRSVTSALILAGGWIEGLYIATSVAGTVNNNEINTRIAEQKLSLENLIGLLESYETDENINSLLIGLKELQKNYDGVEVPISKTEVSTNSKTGITTIGSSKNHLVISKEQLKSISNKIESIRNKIIK